jgi:signal transduction histidine kinase
MQTNGVRRLATYSGEGGTAVTLSVDSAFDADQLRAIYRVGKLVRASLDLDVTLSAIVAATREVTPAELTAILLLTEDNELEFRVGGGALATAVGQRVPVDAGIVGRALREGAPVLIPDLLVETGRARPDLDDVTGARAYIAAPLVWRGEVLGVVTVATRAAGGLTIRDAALVEELAEQAAAAVAHARAYTREQTRRVESEALNRRLAERTDQLQSAQRQLLDNEKLAAIGQLAHGIAHELNTPLGVILSNLSVLEQYATGMLTMAAASQAAAQQLRAGAAPSSTADALDAAAEAADLAFVLDDLPQLTSESSSSAERIASIVRSLAMLARQNQGELTPVKVEEALESAITLAWNALKQHAQVVRSFGGVPPVRGLLSDLIEVFVHLLLNAAQALETPGVITVGTAVRGSEIEITITDTGRGIAREHLPRIFEPFFSTRGPGRGAGMGLPVCHGIVTRHGGSIDLQSAPGQGTTVTVRLPAALTPEVSM